MAEYQSKHHQEKPLNSPEGREMMSDSDLAARVKEALLAETESAGIDVKVSVEDGVVRLYGVVDVLSHRRAAEEIARQVPGVRKIENAITIADEEHMPDKELQDTVTEELTAYEEFLGLGCRVNKGAVTLMGSAGSYEDVDEAVRMVEGIPGVVEVRVQQIKVGEGETGDDAEVSRQAQQMLDQMGYDHTLFTVYCDAGVLYVKGFVNSRAEKGRIKAAMHRIPGVAKLDAMLVTDDQLGDQIH